MNRPHAVGTLMVRLEDTNGRVDSDNSAGVVEMHTGRPSRRKWWRLTGNKEDRFIWQGTCSKGEEILYKPNFEYAAEQDSPGNSKKQGTNERLSDNDIGIGEKKKCIIDQRMKVLSSLFTCYHSGHRDNSSGIRATHLTDDQFADIVLNQTHPQQEEDKDETKISEHGMKQIIHKYQDCRQEKRNLANTYIADRRSILPEPWVERDEGEQSSVQIDRHGRLLRTRRESNNNDAAANDDHASESSDGALEEFELVDAAGEYWRQCKKLWNEDASRGNTRRGSSVVSNATAPAPPVMQRPQQPPPLLQPLPQNPLNQQHIRERRIAQQMENESRQAIERAIHRYRGQQQERDEAVFEMVNIPLVRPMNETNVPRWLRFLSFNRPQRHQQQQHPNNNDAGENPNQQQNDPNEQQNHQNGERGDDLRLALRRICFAVITVAAAFICMMLEGLPLVDFGDDLVMDLNPTFLSGLMGPHYHGHHDQQHHDQHMNGWVFPEIAEEEEEGDVQRSIWNRLGVEDRHHIPRHIAPEGAGQSSNQGREEL